MKYDEYDGKIKIFTIREKYYIAFEENRSDWSTAKKLGISIDIYRENIERICKDEQFEFEIYFSKKENAEKALEWTESIITLGKICE